MRKASGNSGFRIIHFPSSSFWSSSATALRAMAATRAPTGLTFRAVRSLGPAVGLEEASSIVAQAAATTHRTTAAPRAGATAGKYWRKA